MAGRFPDTVFRAQVGSTVYPGAKLYIYENGTTTKVGAGVALDARNGSDVSNPLIMDANGEADLWLKPGSQYTLKLDDANDVQLRSKDGISANDLESWITSGNDISYQAGNVGIGGDAGTETLLVTGSCKITSTLEVTGTVTCTRSFVANDEGAWDSRIETNNSEYAVNVDSSADIVALGCTTSDTNTGSIIVGLSSVTITPALTINSQTDFLSGVDIQSGDLDVESGNFTLSGNFTMDTSGATFGLPSSGATDPSGGATLNGTTGVTIANTNIAAGDRIIFSRSSTSSGYGDLYSTISAGVSFTVFSTDASDDGGIYYLVIKNAA